ncbi:unnamed protein product [Cunninghamella echinulata]
MTSLKTLYVSPLVQIVLLGFICLCCPGFFNAISALGAGGGLSENITIISTTNGVLYACFTFLGLFAGSICNKLGVKLTLAIGSIGYAVYVSSLWVYDTKQVGPYVIVSGAILGCCASLFWAAQGAIMMSYPKENEKGKFVGIFWALFNSGGVLGALIALLMNLNSSAGVSTGTYTAFVIVMLIGVVMTFLLASPSSVKRSDGTMVEVSKASTWQHELKAMVHVWGEWRMVALIPAFLASNWFYAYQFHLNAVYFDAATRPLNSLMYWGFQILASVLIGFLLDYTGMKRRTRGLVGLVVMYVFMMAVWVCGFIFQRTFSNDFASPIHWTDPNFGAPFVLFLFYGFSDALYQSYLYWLMGAMSNDPALLARYAAFYKAIQSAGAAASYGIDASGVPLIWQCVVCWVLVAIALPGIFLVANKVTDTNIVDTDPSIDTKLDYKTKEVEAA